ncbi:DnaB-like helicase C-terminal domain-containing protein [Neobacillus sp. DY30]|uniref:DnaB-like helicase C-terminal domain-containing protein n=1 Tax=Neobacillus sp. DY30 TaxID=3047871 RepID=UPI0024BF5567|nr:DnaB-like helicase C-terminal domain-containing protein [Neobacillus sp. DY30]WHY01818.1 DnaB-like helicase C-terminal domain-containing protein [Neobacillus sp. DY30]
MHHAQLLFSKVIDANDVAVLTRYGITAKDLPTEGDRHVFRFVTEYADKNRGQAPSYAEVTAQCPDFNYTPQVGDSYEYLAKEIKKHSAKVQFAELVNGKLGKQFETVGQKDIFKLFEWLQSEVESIKINTNTSSKIGTDIKKDAESFLEEYRKRKAGESFKIWKSKFAGINEQIGGYLSGNMYTWHGRSGRGKSVFTMEEAIEAAAQGANVLVWAMEMSRFEWMARAYSSISARAGIVNANIDGVDYEAGFENKALLTGKLSDEFEAGFEVFLLQMAEGEHLPGNITVRAADDVDFFNRDIKQLEADILATKADVVVVDPIYLMDYEANTSKVAGGDVANTSKRIRRLAGLTGAVIHVITQADEVKDDRDDEGNRELRPPKRAEIKKTKAVLEDAANVFGIDTLDGAGIIEIGKGRNGGEGTQVEVLYLPNFGIVREVATGEEVAKQFDF